MSEEHPLRIKLAIDLVRELSYGSLSEGGWVCVHNEFTDHTRWGLRYLMVIRKDSDPDGPFYAYGYEVGATENQDHTSWDDEGDEVELYLVERREKFAYDYIKVRERLG